MTLWWERRKYRTKIELSLTRQGENTDNIPAKSGKISLVVNRIMITLIKIDQRWDRDGCEQQITE